MDHFVASVREFLHQEVPGLRFSWNYLINTSEQVYSSNSFIMKSLVPSQSTHVEFANFLAIAIIPMVFFYCYGLLFFLVDTLSTEKFKRKYKIQHTIEINYQQYFNALIVSIFNWVFIAWPILYCLCFYIQPRLYTPNTHDHIPTIINFIKQLTISVVIEDIFFYTTHRILHYPLFYAPIHKFHHKFTAPFAIAAVYAHPIEHICSNVVPLTLGPLYCRAHATMAMAWGVLALFNTMTVHSGYDLAALLPFMPSPYGHDWHHEKFNENFGVLFLDYLCCTNTKFLIAWEKGEILVPRKEKKGQ